MELKLLISLYLDGGHYPKIFWRRGAMQAEVSLDMKVGGRRVRQSRVIQCKTLPVVAGFKSQKETMSQGT